MPRPWRACWRKNSLSRSARLDSALQCAAAAPASLPMDKTERELRDMLADRRLVQWPTEPQWNAIWLAANAKGHQGGVSAAVHRVAPGLLNSDWIEMMGVDPAEAKMMWAEICVRSSVSPFVDVNTPYTDAQKAEATFQGQFKEFAAKGWTVVSNGPEGMELQAPRKFPLGWFSKPETRFLPRPRA
jgi:hypothetical protein